MKRVFYVGHDAEVAQFVAELAPMERPVWPEGYRAFGVLDERNRLIFGAVFSEWKPEFGTIQLSAAGISSYLLSPDIVAALEGYAYRQLQANRVWSRTSIRNRKAIRLLKHIGFRPEGASADYFGPGHAAETYRMLRKEWLAKTNFRDAA